MIKQLVLAVGVLAAMPVYAEDLVEPPTSPVIVSNPPADVQEARRGGGSAGSVGSGGIIAIGTLITVGIIYGIVKLAQDN